jgi:glycosyltransferase involved in cell wall biosynthesis
MDPFPALNERPRDWSGAIVQPFRQKAATRIKPDEPRAGPCALADLEARLRDKDQEINALWSQVQSLRAQLSAITSSRAYRCAALLNRIGRRLVPPATRRETMLRLACRTVQVATREGPSGVARKALEKLLASLRRRRLRIAPKATRAANGAGAFQPGLVSVILPVYNQADLLPEAIESVLKQDYPLFELIVVNDGSRDGALTVLERYYRHPRIRILTQANQKLPTALNNGFDLAQGEFWTWTSADNLMEPSQLSRLVDYLRRHPEADMVYADYLAIDDRGEPLTDPTWRPQNRRPSYSPEVRLPHSTQLLNSVQDNFIGACFLYRGQVGQVIGEYDAQLLGVEDYDYWMRVNRLFTIQHLDSEELLYRYRVHDNSMTAQARELGIYERGKRLMAHEGERASSYQQPWQICVDPAVAAWLVSVDTRPHQVIPCTPGAALPGSAAKRMLLAAPQFLSGLPSDAAFDAIVAWVDGLPSSAYEGGIRLAQRAALCLTTSRELAQSAALCHDRVITVDGPAEGLRVALAFAKGHAFSKRPSASSNSPEANAGRQPAEAFRPANRPLRVLVQVDCFGQGGLEQVVLDLLSGLRKAGAWVTLLAAHEDRLPPKVTGQADRVAYLPATSRENAYRELLAKEKIDLVSSHYSLFGAGIVHELGVPFVQTVQNTYVWLTPAQIEEHRRADPFTTAYICVSPEVARYSDLKLGLSEDKMLVLANGVSADLGDLNHSGSRRRLRAELGIPTEAFAFLNAASIYPPKAQRCALRALRQVHDAGHDAWLIFLGGVFDATYHQDLLREVNRLRLNERVLFAGHRDDVAAFHAAADAFVLPSFWEGSSLALAEAVLAGLPAVVSRVGSADEFAGIAGITRVEPPFASILDIDHRCLKRLLNADHDDYVERLAHAMINVCVRPVRPVLSPRERRALDRDTIIASYHRLFLWLAQGGQPAACRAGLRHGAWSEEPEALNVGRAA